MLNHVSCGIPPIIKDLTTKNMAANTPDRLVALLSEPLVAQLLCVKVVDLE